jgi:GAF domain-containing protein
VRLLQTLANSMSVALENARLFDETQRLFKESEQRARELAIINSVQQALAAELNIQGIYDAVGDKIREIFHQRDVASASTIPRADWSTSRTTSSGERIDVPQPVRDKGFSAHVLRTGETLVVNEDMAGALGSTAAHDPGHADGTLGVSCRLIAAARSAGSSTCSTTTASTPSANPTCACCRRSPAAMSVALENARLFDETQRLYKESEQRAAELAIINSVQQALAAELNIQGIYDAVGEKIREIFRGADVGIRIIDPKSGMIHFPFAYEQGRRVPIDPVPLGGFTAHVVRTREVLVVNENMAVEMKKHGSTVLPGTQLPKAQMFVPLFTGDQVRGALYVQDLEHEHAFEPSHVRLLQTIANTMGVAARERAPLRRDPASLQGKRAACRGARDRQHGVAAARGKSR